MTTQETQLAAVERLRDDDYRDQRSVMIDKATIYDAEHDPRPLTLELCKEVLGEPDRTDGPLVWWGNNLMANAMQNGSLRFLLAWRTIRFDSPKVWQLRTLVRLLRGGA